MPKATGFSPAVQSAYKSGPDIIKRDWRNLPVKQLNRAERVMMFAEHYLKVPEGSKVGQPVKLAEFQEALIYSVFQEKNSGIHVRRAILSMARKNAKTVTTAIILLAYMLTDEAEQNSQLCSGAMSREQAALIYRHMTEFINHSPELKPLVHLVPSKKQLIAMKRNVTFTALAKEGSTTVGRSDKVLVLDEIGQITAETDSFVEALVTSQGAHEHPLQIAISTQAANDRALLSQWIDDAQRSDDQSIVCWLYEADKDCDLLDEEQWSKANPALDLFRSRRDLEEQLKQAQRLPSMENSARNLLLNQRISLQSLFIAPQIWKVNSGQPDLDAFRHYPVWVGLDLSLRHDLTAAVAACQDDDGVVHVQTFAFVPLDNITDKERIDKAPYTTWIRQGDLHAVPGNSVDYGWVAQFLKARTQDWNLIGVCFDRWRIDLFQRECELHDWLVPNWTPVGQGYRDISPRLETIEGLLLDGKIRHGSAPLLNMAAANAIVTQDPAGNRKIDKSKTTSKIDPLVAAVMAIHQVSHNEVQQFDVSALVG